MSKEKDKQNKQDHKPFDPTDSNPDPITGQPGAHPIGTGVGATGAGAVGAVVGGVVGGPVGAVVGSVVGGVVGGLVGKGAAETINPTVEEEYWRANYNTRPYVKKGETYEAYQPAYRTGYEGYSQYSGTGRNFDQSEADLRRDYESKHSGGKAGLAWDKAKYAAKDAWERVENAMPGQQHDRTDTSDRVDTRDQQRVRLHEERLVADKHREKTGEVTVGKHVETERAQVSVPLEKEEVIIERRTPKDAGRPVAPGEAAFSDTEVARMEVYEETPDIHKEAFVREEVNVKKVVDRDTAQVEDQVRRETLDVDKKGRKIVDRLDRDS